MTYAEYVAFERTAARKHEWVNGEVYAMAGVPPSTRGEKWHHYRRIPSLSAYVLVDSTAERI
ncbi:MAG: hypothetical protein AB7S26_38170 [Sandaracinaceae bacterium]